MLQYFQGGIIGIIVALTMGKQSRRKRQRSRARPTPTEQESPSTLLQKLRHSDSQTRHAALIALTCTLLHPEQLSCNNNNNNKSKRVVSSDILNAVRELVLSNDLECAHAAAMCCVNFLQFGHRHDKDSLTAGWTLVFSQRLATCQEALSTLGTTAKQWLALTVQCLMALCALVETNPLALDYIILDSNTTVDNCAMLISLAKFAKETLQTTTTTRTNDQDEYIRDIAVYALRILHSTLDDNIIMLQTCLSSRTAKDEWNFIHESCTCPTLPLTARLHAAACLVTARQLGISIVDQQEWTSTLFQRAVLETVVPLLQQSIRLPTTSYYQNLLCESIQAHELLQNEEEDCAMERDVISAVQAKGESARSIAKRQAQLKNNTSNQDKQKDDDAATHVQSEDAQKVWNQVQAKWQEIVSPVTLALELVANVTSVVETISHDDDDDGMNHDMEMNDDLAWGPQQEEALLINQIDAASTTTTCHPLDAALLTSLGQSGLGESLVTLLKSVCIYTDDMNKSVHDNISSLPQSIEKDVEDLQSKCAAALGNYIGNVTNWQIPKSLWKDLQLAAESSTGMGTEGVFDAMAVAVQTRPQVRTHIQAEDLEFLMGQLSCTTSSDKITVDVVSILGLLCSAESHPLQVNEKVCGGLLSLLQSSSSAMVLSEVFNALMDMYGDDDHAQVFDSLHVLGNFQRNLPRFKQRIQAERNKAQDQSVVEQWRETALNASRFISYKKGQL
jgi:hypothetical protein